MENVDAEKSLQLCRKFSRAECKLCEWWGLLLLLCFADDGNTRSGEAVARFLCQKIYALFMM